MLLVGEIAAFMPQVDDNTVKEINFHGFKDFKVKVLLAFFTHCCATQSTFTTL